MTTLNITTDKWYWCDLANHTVDLWHGWPHAAVCEVENDSENNPGFAVSGKDVLYNFVSIIEYTAQRDGVTRELLVDTPIKKLGDTGIIGGQIGTRLDVFGQKVLFRLAPVPSDI